VPHADEIGKRAKNGFVSHSKNVLHCARCGCHVGDHGTDGGCPKPGSVIASPSLPTISEGIKLDNGKPRADLTLDGFGLALLAVAEVATFGASKYGEHNWQEVDNGEIRYRAAGDRHRLRRFTEETDDETGLRHLAHEAWNRLAELELILRGER
jgi:hypothetical protein